MIKPSLTQAEHALFDEYAKLFAVVDLIGSSVRLAEAYTHAVALAS